MKPIMTRLATSVSMASSSGNSKSSSAAAGLSLLIDTPPTNLDPAGPRHRHRSFRLLIDRQVGTFGQNSAHFAKVEFRPLIPEQGQADSLAAHVAQLYVHEMQPLVEHRRREDHLAAGAYYLGPAPEADGLVHPDAIAEYDEARGELGVGPHQIPP